MILKLPYCRDPLFIRPFFAPSNAIRRQRGAAMVSDGLGSISIVAAIGCAVGL
jgi:hypothetical protein